MIYVAVERGYRNQFRRLMVDARRMEDKEEFLKRLYKFRKDISKEGLNERIKIAMQIKDIRALEKMRAEIRATYRSLREVKAKEGNTKRKTLEGASAGTKMVANYLADYNKIILDAIRLVKEKKKLEMN